MRAEESDLNWFKIVVFRVDEIYFTHDIRPVTFAILQRLREFYSFYLFYLFFLQMYTSHICTHHIRYSSVEFSGQYVIFPDISTRQREKLGKCVVTFHSALPKGSKLWIFHYSNCWLLTVLFVGIFIVTCCLYFFGHAHAKKPEEWSTLLNFISKHASIKL